MVAVSIFVRFIMVLTVLITQPIAVFGQTESPPIAEKTVAAETPPVRKKVEDSPAPAGFNNAVNLYSRGKYAQAAAVFEGFVKKGTANSQSRLYLGAAYQALKKYDKALAQYDWVGKNAPLISLKQKGIGNAKALRAARTGICPGNCLKLTTPGWQTIAGRDPNVRWMKFRESDGWSAWSTNHVGEVIEFANGRAVNKGKCPICGGTGRVAPLP